MFAFVRIDLNLLPPRQRPHLGNQVSALLECKHQVILIDSRGHGRSTLCTTPLFV